MGIPAFVVFRGTTRQAFAQIRICDHGVHAPRMNLLHQIDQGASIPIRHRDQGFARYRVQRQCQPQFPLSTFQELGQFI